MYEVSEKYKAAIKSHSRYSKVQGTITLSSGTVMSISDENIVSGTLSVENQCVNGEELCFGSVYAAQLKFSFNSEIDRYSLYDAVVKLSYYLLVGDNEWEDIPLGVFTVTEATRKFSTISVSALDNMLYLNADLEADNTNGNPWELLKYVSLKTGIELSQTQTEILALPNANYVYGLPVNGGNITTYRDLVADLSQILGCFATMDRLGKLAFRTFSNTPNVNIDSSSRTDSSISDFKVFYTALNIVAGNMVFSAATQNNDGLTMNIKDNCLMLNGVDEFKQRVTDDLFKILTVIEYTPCDVGCNGDPALDLGDMLSLTNDTTINCLITDFKWKYRGSHSLKGVGKNPRSMNAKSKTDKALDSANSNASEGKVAVAVYENAVDHDITSSWIEVIRMDYMIAKDSIPLFCGVVDINLITHGEIEFKYESNQAEIAFYPKQLLPKGNHHITLHFPITNALSAFANTFRVFIKSTDALAHISPACIKADIIASGLNSASGLWDGKLEFEESIHPLTLKAQKIQVDNFVGELQSIELPSITSNSFTETFTGISITPNNIKLCTINETMVVGELYKGNTIYGKNIKDEPYVEFNSEVGLKLKTVYEIQGEEQPIDAGKLMVFNIPTDIFINVAEIEVT